MRPSHQFVAVGIGVLVSLSQAAPGLSQAGQASVGPSALDPSLATQDAQKEASQVQSGSSSSATSADAPTEPASAADPKPSQVPQAEAQAPPATNAESLPQPQAPAVERTPSAPAPQKPAAIAKPAPRSGAKKPAKQPTPTAKPANLADFKSRNQPALTQATPVTPGSPTPPTGVDNTAPAPILIPNGILTPGESSPSKPIGPAKQGSAPDYLNPNPNPLTIPTRPEDVRVRGIQPITLQQALELAKQNNRDLQVATLQLERSRAALREAQAALYPTVGLQAGLTQQQTAAGQLQEEASRQAQAALPRELRQIQRTDRANLALSGTVEVGYNIFTSGLRPAQIRSAQQQVRSDQLSVEVTEQQIRLDVSNAYYNLQEADEAVRIREAAVRNAEASLRDTQALERAGLGTRFDVLRAQVQLANAQQDLTNALATRQTRRRELTQILAAPVYVDLAAADPVEIAGSWNLTLPQTLILALKNRAELEQQLAQREFAEQQRRAALAALGPTVSLRVQYEVLNNLRDTLGFGDGYSVTAGVNWNFFDGGAARARANQQEANKAIAETRFAQARENIQLQVESSFSNLQSTFLNIGTNRQAVAQAREALRLARLRFQAGVGTQTDVINAENDLTRAEGNLVTAIIGYNRALASLQRSVTNLPIPTGSTTPSLPAPAPPLPPIQTF